MILIARLSNFVLISASNGKRDSMAHIHLCHLYFIHHSIPVPQNLDGVDMGADHSRVHPDPGGGGRLADDGRQPSRDHRHRDRHTVLHTAYW